MDTTSIIESVSVIIAAWAIIIGVTAWRREYVGKRNLELAEEVLSMFYESKDIISAIRNPFSFAGEGSTRKAAPNESPEEKQAYDRAFVTYERYNKHSEFLNKLFSMRYRYMARFGNDSCKPFDDLNEIIREILTAADMLSYYWTERASRASVDDQGNLDEIKRNQSTIWQMGSRDTIIPRIEKLVSDIEAQSRKILEPKLIDRIKQWFMI